MLRTTNKTTRIKLVEIHHMECLNQLLRQRQAQRRRGQQQTGEQSRGAGSRVFLSYRQTRLGFRTNRAIAGTLKPQLLVVFVAIL